MKNHYHLLVRTSNPDLSAGMHYLNCVYAQGFNRRHNRVGHLFQGRFKARLVQDGPRLLWTARYIARNPIETRRGEEPSEHRWNSHWEVLGLVPPWHVDTRTLLAHFHHDRRHARELYREFVEGVWSGTGDRYADPAHPLIDGDEDYVNEQLARILPAPAYPTNLLAPPRPGLPDLLGTRPATTDIAAAHAAGYSCRDIGKHLGLHKSTMAAASALE